jgi:hypothetical protein
LVTHQKISLKPPHNKNYNKYFLNIKQLYIHKEVETMTGTQEETEEVKRIMENFRRNAREAERIFERAGVTTKQKQK